MQFFVVFFILLQSFKAIAGDCGEYFDALSASEIEIPELPKNLSIAEQFDWVRARYGMNAADFRESALSSTQIKKRDQEVMGSLIKTAEEILREQNIPFTRIPFSRDSPLYSLRITDITALRARYRVFRDSRFPITHIYFDPLLLVRKQWNGYFVRGNESIDFGKGFLWPEIFHFVFKHEMRHLWFKHLPIAHPLRKFFSRWVSTHEGDFTNLHANKINAMSKRLGPQHPLWQIINRPKTQSGYFYSLFTLEELYTFSRGILDLARQLKAHPPALESLQNAEPIRELLKHALTLEGMTSYILQNESFVGDTQTKNFCRALNTENFKVFNALFLVIQAREPALLNNRLRRLSRLARASAKISPLDF